MLNVVNFSSSMITAELASNQAPGTFLLRITSGAQAATFDVTIGASGPQGPAGRVLPALRDQSLSTRHPMRTSSLRFLALVTHFLEHE